MKTVYTPYRDRVIAFVETLQLGTVSIKIYTISNKEMFASNATLKAVYQELENWLAIMSTSSLRSHDHAFLIVHEAQEGNIILFNWWTGENMIETKLFFASHDQPDKIQRSLFESKQLVCVWELELFYHERKAWIQHVLSKPSNPDYLAYQNDIYQKEYERIS